MGRRRERAPKPQLQSAQVASRKFGRSALHYIRSPTSGGPQIIDSEGLHFASWQSKFVRSKFMVLTAPRVVKRIFRRSLVRSKFMVLTAPRVVKRIFRRSFVRSKFMVLTAPRVVKRIFRRSFVRSKFMVRLDSAWTAPGQRLDSAPGSESVFPYF